MMLREPEAGQLSLIFEAAGAGRRIWPVSELVGRARELVEREFADVWVEGEISNLRPAASGHLYFTLKDAEAQLPVVMFRRQAALMRFRAEDGLHVLARGRVSIYDQRGQMQLVAETMEPVGAGSLQVAFEQLKEKLKKEGLFNAERKRPLPAFPRAAGIVTSPTGAVIRDILNIVGRRHSGLNILLYPVTVQGESAPEEIEAAIACLNDSGLADVIVLARGGGSLEDMAAFNSERVARAIAGSRVPVVSAVGHETDFTIADFVADLRAPTPSAAAELITEAQHKVGEHAERLERRLERGMQFQVLRARQRMAHVSVNNAETRMAMLLHRLEQRLDDAAERMKEIVDAQMRERTRRVDALTAAVLRHDPRQRIALARHNFVTGQTRLERVLERAIDARRARLDGLAARLRSLSPLAVLERGYALVTDAEGKLIRSAAQVTAGKMVKTRLGDGDFTSRVEDVTNATQKQRRRR
jgi:exodeoxyribonuclease VII large subunit